MPALSPASLKKLDTCHPDLRRLILAVAAERNITVLFGHRSTEEQAALFEKGRTTPGNPCFCGKKQNPVGTCKIHKFGIPVTNSKPGFSRHNSSPSEAVDIAPVPLDWHDLIGFENLSHAVEAKAVKLGIPITWGGRFRSVDMPHYELKKVVMTDAKV